MKTCLRQAGTHSGGLDASVSVSRIFRQFLRRKLFLLAENPIQLYFSILLKYQILCQASKDFQINGWKVVMKQSYPEKSDNSDDFEEWKRDEDW